MRKKKIETKPFVYTKQALIHKLKEIVARGFIPNARRGNSGGIGNTLEEYHGTKFRLKQNCLPLLYEKTSIII